MLGENISFEEGKPMSSTSFLLSPSSFLRISGKKSELFRFLVDHVVEKLAGNHVGFTVDDVVSTKPAQNNSKISPCNHEEADTRIFLHVKDMVGSGHSSIKIRTVDTDVVILALAFFRIWV